MMEWRSPEPNEKTKKKSLNIQLIRSCYLITYARQQLGGERKGKCEKLENNVYDILESTMEKRGKCQCNFFMNENLKFRATARLSVGFPIISSNFL